MTDQDNLRDRMAEAMWREDAAVVLTKPYSLPPFYELDPHEQRAYRRSAQAIIDALHLESYPFTRHDGHTTTHVHGWMEPRP